MAETAQKDTSRIEFHLQNWARWMSGGEVTKGYPRKVSYDVPTGQHSFEDMVDVADTRCAIATDALIHGLLPAENNAVKTQYIGGLFRFPPACAALALQSAKRKIEEGLEKRGIW